MRQVGNFGICVVEDENYNMYLVKKWRDGEEPSPRYLYCVSRGRDVVYVLAESEQAAIDQSNLDRGAAIRLPLLVRGWGQHIF
jgi:macrodomain Ter protein organizer (MatP/YcbG family)